MKRSTRFATAIGAVALSAGMSVSPAHAAEPTGSGQALGDAIVGSTVSTSNALTSMFMNTPLDFIPRIYDIATIPVIMLTSAFSVQCHFGDTRGCHAPKP